MIKTCSKMGTCHPESLQPAVLNIQTKLYTL